MADYNQPEYVGKRLRYFHGQFLKDQDFIDEQKYHIDRQRRHNRLLHVSGIIEGLTVNADTHRVNVEPGTAVDRQGRQIVLGHQEPVPLSGYIGQAVALVISYAERGSDQAQEGSEGYTRFDETPELKVVGQDEEAPDSAIPLAELQIDGSGNVTVQDSVHRYSGVLLPDGGADREAWPTLRAGAPGRVDLTGDLTVTGNVGIGTTEPGNKRLRVEGGDTYLGGKLTVTGATRLNNELTVTGNVGIGTTDPEATLDVRSTLKAEVTMIGLAFEDSKAYVDCGDQVSLPDNHTIEFWIKFKDTREDWAQILAKHAPQSDRSPGIWCNPKEASLHWRYDPKNNLGSDHLGPGGVGTQFRLGQWYHVAGVKEGGKLTIYINGVAVGKDIAVPEEMTPGPGSFRIGQTIVPYRDRIYDSFIGQIAEVRIWNRARTAAEINNHMNIKLSGREDGLAGYWPCDDGADGTVKDLTPNANHGTIQGAQWFEEFPPIMTITGHGNVGIGTKEPKAELDVEGTVAASRMVVASKIYGGNACAEATAENPVSTGSRSWVDMDDMKVTVTTGDRHLLILFVVSESWQNSSYTHYLLVLDGRAIGKARHHEVSRHASVAILRMPKVEAGSHTVKVQWMVEGGTAASSSTRTLTVIEL